MARSKTWLECELVSIPVLNAEPVPRSARAELGASLAKGRSPKPNQQYLTRLRLYRCSGRSEYGRSYEPRQPFFEQFFALRATIPQPAMMNDNGVASENCQDFGFSKN